MTCSRFSKAYMWCRRNFCSQLYMASVRSIALKWSSLDAKRVGCPFLRKRSPVSCSKFLSWWHLLRIYERLHISLGALKSQGVIKGIGSWFITFCRSLSIQLLSGKSKMTSTYFWYVFYCKSRINIDISRQMYLRLVLLVREKILE